MDFIANHRIFTQEELNFIQTEKFNNEFVGKSNEKEFERYLKDTNDLYADKIEYTKSIVKELFGIVDIFRISHLGIIYICSDSIGQYFDARSVLYRYGKFLKQKRQAIQNKFTSIDKDKFLEIIQEFLDKVDELRPTGKTTGSMPTQFEKSMNEVLQNLDYVCNFSFGPGILSSVPFINFCPKNILNKDLVNGDKLSGRRGIYIGFGYDYNKQKLDLVIGYGNNDTQECEAKNEIDKYRPNEWEYTYKRDEFGKIKDQIVKDFLNLVSEFNQIPIEYFKPKGAEVIQQTNKSANETNGVPPLNQILYGPPGTGKTYNTINKALEILGIETQGKSRAELKAQFDEFRQNGQIEFVTFHQSFSYEEFVEGIKPVVKDLGDMTYKLGSGIFKKICDKALTNIIKFEEYQVKWKEYEKLAHQFYPDMLEKLKDKNKFVYGDIAFELTKKGNEIQAKGTNGQAIFKNEMTKLLKLENSKKLDKDEIASGISIDSGFSHLYEAMRDYFFNEYLKDKAIKEQPQIESELKPYILIIDEINRGNISKILGELITLIEPSKRIGGDEELRVSLPYSANEFDGGKGFGVPKNLYIIGTMNTADRSIALLDTALRRRFEFVEMMPEPELLEIIKVENGEINLQMLLEKMNARIEFLLDREHTIGHSFFINVNSLSELQQVFKNKIIPLLQEYFYDDYAKIDAVLNGNGMIKLKKDSTLEKLFDTNFKSDLDSEKVVYQIINSNKWNEKNFLRIYDSSVQIDKDE